jgi:hypothetical protein
MGVTRIRYLLDQWRLRSVAVGLRNGFGKDQPPSDWKLPAVEDPSRKPLQDRRDGADPPRFPPS